MNTNLKLQSYRVNQFAIIRKFWALFLFCLIIVFPCAGQTYSTEGTYTGTGKGGSLYLGQGWDARLQELFYFTPQGSRLIPYRWLQVLEQSDSSQRFASVENLTKYGWLFSAKPSALLNPGGFPIGFTQDTVDQPGTGKWAGLTCAACHTNDITYKGKVIRIDGAPANIDLDRFFTDLANAVKATLVDKAKMQRFVTNVLGNNPDFNKAKQLENDYIGFATTVIGQMHMRTPPLRTGPGRVDALGQIINALAVFDLKEPDNLRAPNAPVSYPFLWLTPKLAWVQWDPISSNPIARNAGEVLGVFGHANLTGSEKEIFHTKKEARVRESFQEAAQSLIPPHLRKQILIPLNDKINRDKAALDKFFGHEQGIFSSTVLYKNLFELEQWLTSLEPPVWQESLFGKIDKDLAKQGEVLFKKDCLSCHNMPPFAMTPKEENIIGKQFIQIGRINYKEVGTDSTYVENMTQRYAKTGTLGSLLFENQPVVPGGAFFLGTVGAIVQKGFSELGLPTKDKLLYSDYRFYPPKSPGEAPLPYKPPNIDVLKAGPLLGIWATAPYLHNGSVPNLYELLLPPTQRSKMFYTGSREFDPVKLGFVSTEAPGLFRLDTALTGNGNGGHFYPAIPYTEEQRMAVIEYLKDPSTLNHWR